ncbi:MOSC domain-containing protein [Marinobacter caseinilyticus]|uniref:MOSC domain-containing protein n=1 Tax=Marinobacter caseinilyticus TaxID=2692195 RepID=UPI00140DA573|nr:MOSC domain-containing protein [Marinobacter caseinilyticus]
MEVVSVNVSVPRNVDYEGNTLSTGIFKQPVRGPVYLSKTNLAGDRQADLKNHGGEDKAVYAFSSDHYPYWREVLGPPDLSPGTFGENLTIAGLDESALHIGDQLRIGSCLLEVSQPRVPCFKLGLAVGQKTMPRMFSAHAETGVYLRVLSEGYIAAGDSVTVVRQGASGLSVKALYRAVYDRTCRESQAIMARAVLIPELSRDWKDMLSVRLSRGH